jgi:putative spermidine/putrescine transport system ATP-binding protein
MRELVLGLQRELGVTTLFVTHDQEEAVVLADRIALVLDGRLQQRAPPTDFYDAPASLPVARFRRREPAARMVSAGVHASALGAAAVEAPDGHGTLVVRQEAVALTGPHMPGALPGRVHAATFLGTSMRVTGALPVAGPLRIDDGLKHPAEEPAHELAAVGGAEHLDHFEQGRIV